MSSDPVVKEAISIKKRKVDNPYPEQLLGKREFSGKSNLGISELVNFQSNQTQQEEEIEYGDPSGIEPFMMLDLDELTDLTKRKTEEKKEIDQIGLSELLNTENPVNVNFREREEEDEIFAQERLIELDSRFRGSGFKGIMGGEVEMEENGRELSENLLEFNDLMDITTDEKKQRKKGVKKKKNDNLKIELGIGDLISASTQDPKSSVKKLKI